MCGCRSNTAIVTIVQWYTGKHHKFVAVYHYNAQDNKQKFPSHKTYIYSTPHRGVNKLIYRLATVVVTNSTPKIIDVD